MARKMRTFLENRNKFVIIIFVFLIKLLVLETFKLNEYFLLDSEDVTDWTTDTNKALRFLHRHNALAAKQCYYSVTNEWNYATNITLENRKRLLKAIVNFNAFNKKESLIARSYNWTHFPEDIKRQLEKISIIGTAILEGNDEREFNRVLNEMQTVYSTAKVCIRGECGLELDPDLTEIMAKSNDYNKLLETWVKWRDSSGKQLREKYIRYYRLGNRAAKLNQLPDKKFNTLSDLWLFQWETPDIREQMKNLLQQLMPFYRKLQAYVRIKLNDAFEGQMPKDGTIPAHLLGNMWAQQWANTMNTVKGVDPYPQIETIDATNALRNENYSPKQLYELSDRFLTDLGLDPMNANFWRKSVFEKPSDGTQMVCHASAWDFYTTDDFRIKECSKVNMESLIRSHHEMGHIQYYRQYRHQAVVFREGANPGFHEAIGDLLTLSVTTPKHLNKLGLLDINETMDMKKINLKHQMRMALVTIPLLPFAYIMDKWRADVFSGQISTDNLNRHWWTLRGQYQGISPPVKRSERHFDPGAKYHIVNSVEYMRYFVSQILQFQFHKALCSYGQKGVPLHECDIDGDKEAGNKLKQMLALGSSKQWPKQLKLLTGSQQMDVRPLLEYFKPLLQFLDQEIDERDIGWSYSVDDYFEE